MTCGRCGYIHVGTPPENINLLRAPKLARSPQFYGVFELGQKKKNEIKIYEQGEEWGWGGVKSKKNPRLNLYLYVVPSSPATVYYCSSQKFFSTCHKAFFSEICREGRLLLYFYDAIKDRDEETTMSVYARERKLIWGRRGNLQK